jgi:hypothetical protein
MVESPWEIQYWREGWKWNWGGGRALNAMGKLCVQNALPAPPPPPPTSTKPISGMKVNRANKLSVHLISLENSYAITSGISIQNHCSFAIQRAICLFRVFQEINSYYFPDWFLFIMDGYFYCEEANSCLNKMWRPCLTFEQVRKHNNSDTIQTLSLGYPKEKTCICSSRYVIIYSIRLLSVRHLYLIVWHLNQATCFGH